jgi:hypothetical protein
MRIGYPDYLGLHRFLHALRVSFYITNVCTFVEEKLIWILKKGDEFYTSIILAVMLLHAAAVIHSD